jgi:hypothetical protein
MRKLQKKTQMESNRDYNINQRKKKSRKNLQANSIHRKPYYLQKIEGANTTSHEGRTKESVGTSLQNPSRRKHLNMKSGEKSEKYPEKEIYIKSKAMDNRPHLYLK